MLRTLPLIAIAFLLLGCHPSAPAPSAGNEDKAAPTAQTASTSPPAAPEIERVRRIRIPSNVKFEVVRDKSNKENGVSIIARDNDVHTLTCGCISACPQNSKDPCAMQRDDQTGSTIAWCTGSCVGSEIRSCGGCTFVPSDDTVTPHDFASVLGVDVLGPDEPGVEIEPPAPSTAAAK